jgi:hypothetical protein
MTDTAHTGTGRETHIPVDINQPLLLEVHNPHGDVTVRGADRADVLISYRGPGHAGNPGDVAAGPIVDAHGNRIAIYPHSHEGAEWAAAADIDLDAVFGQIARAFRRGGPWVSAKAGKVRVPFGHPAGSDITIETPRTMTGRVAIHTVGGDVRIESMTSDITLQTASGDVRLAHTRGDHVLQTASGDLAIEDMAGRLTVRAASGDVNVTSAQIEGFEVQTANGDVLLDALLAGDGPSYVQTASGDVRLTLRQPAADEEEPAASLAFHTISGDAHVAPPFRPIDRGRWQAGSGQAGPQIDITTVSGDLAAAFAPASDVGVTASRPTSPGDEASAAASSPRHEAALTEELHHPQTTRTTAEDDAGRLAVLEAVERGEIDIEEALRRLEAADAITAS